MINHWFRLWHDMPTDAKWRTIARTSGRSVSEVIAVALHMMTFASTAQERGVIEGFEDEDVATALDVRTEAITAIRNAMQGRFLEGDRLVNWRRRQPLKEDATSSKRVEEFRARQAAQGETPCNATKRHVTLDKKKRREEQKDLLPPPGEGGLADASRPPPCPHEEIIALYHAILPMCPRVLIWSDTRQGYLRARWNQAPTFQSLDFWEAFFTRVSGSDFLTGRTQGKNGAKPFLADLEWMVRPANFIKIVERKYDNA